MKLTYSIITVFAAIIINLNVAQAENSNTSIEIRSNKLISELQAFAVKVIKQTDSRTALIQSEQFNSLLERTINIKAELTNADVNGETFNKLQDNLEQCEMVFVKLNELV